jgi:hypothetical protein
MLEACQHHYYIDDNIVLIMPQLDLQISAAFDISKQVDSKTPVSCKYTQTVIS